MKREALLDLNEVLQHPGRRLLVELQTDLDQEADIDLLRPLEGTLEAVSTGNLLLLTGTFKTRAVLECARCNAPLEQELEFELEEQFPVEGIPSSYSSQDFARVVPDEPFQLFEGNALIVDALLRQNLLLSIPMQTFCPPEAEATCQAGSRESSREKAARHPAMEQLSRLRTPEEDAS